MMEALGQLAKDGSLLAPAHKHIGKSVLWTPPSSLFCIDVPLKSSFHRLF